MFDKEIILLLLAYWMGGAFFLWLGAKIERIAPRAYWRGLAAILPVVMISYALGWYFDRTFYMDEVFIGLLVLAAVVILFVLSAALIIPLYKTTFKKALLLNAFAWGGTLLFSGLAAFCVFLVLWVLEGRPAG